MKNSPSLICEAAGCDTLGSFVVLFGLLKTDVEHPAELEGPRYYSDRRWLCREHAEAVKRSYVHTNISARNAGPIKGEKAQSVAG